MHRKRQLVHKTVKKTKGRKKTKGISDNKNTNEGERIIKTIYGRLEKKPHRLMY